MKIQDNSASYPDYSIEQLNEELAALNQAKQTATTTGTGTEGVENLIQKVTREIRRRNGEKIPTEAEIEQADTAIKQFREQQASVPESEKVYLDSPKFDGPIGQPVANNILESIVAGDYQLQPEVAVALDGGTVSFTAKDTAGSTHELYLDRRMNSETTNEFYEGAYPGREGSILLGKNDALLSKIEDLLRKTADGTAQTDNEYQNPVDGKTYVADGGWQDHQPQNPQPADPNAKVKLGGIRLLTDEATVAANLSSEDLSNYIKAVVTALEPTTLEAQTPFQVMLQFELKPVEKVSIQIASQGEVGDDILQKVYDATLAVSAPQPSTQPITFQATISFNS